jgi:hypothetical protein
LGVCRVLIEEVNFGPDFERVAVKVMRKFILQSCRQSLQLFLAFSSKHFGRCLKKLFEK